MTSLWTGIIFILCAYLVGTIPQLQVIARLNHVKLEGDYHSCLWHKAGKIVGLSGVVGEFIKGVIPVIAGRLLEFDINFIAVAGVAAVCGQMWPVFQGFNGEKGNSIGLSMSASLAYQPFLIALIPIVIGAGIRTVKRLLTRSNNQTSIIGGNYSKSLPLGMLVGFLVLPLASWYLNQPPGVTLSFAALFILILIRRSTAGLMQDLKKSSDLYLILKGRLLYDRGISKYRI
jgi:acyl phosphate:glycerol-3-phosphate acyltransferase